MASRYWTATACSLMQRHIFVTEIIRLIAVWKLSLLTNLIILPFSSSTSIRNDRKIKGRSDRGLVNLARYFINNKSWVPENEIEALLHAGFTRQQVFEVILTVSIKTLSNYVNQLTQPAPNPYYWPCCKSALLTWTRNNPRIKTWRKKNYE